MQAQTRVASPFDLRDPRSKTGLRIHGSDFTGKLEISLENKSGLILIIKVTVCKCRAGDRVGHLGIFFRGPEPGGGAMREFFLILKKGKILD